jgi:hypothetical protein
MIVYVTNFLKYDYHTMLFTQSQLFDWFDSEI